MCSSLILECKFDITKDQSFKNSYFACSLNLVYFFLSKITKKCPTSFREETNPHLATTFFQVVVQSGKVSLKSPVPWLFQPVPSQLVQLHYLCCLSMDTLIPWIMGILLWSPFLLPSQSIRYQKNDWYY